MKTISKFAIRPENKEMRRKFLKFRTDDVKEMFDFACINAVLMLVFYVARVFYLKKFKDEIRALSQLIVVLVYLIVWLLGQRFKFNFMRLLVGCIVTHHVIIILSEEVLIRDDILKNNSGGSSRLVILLAVNCLLLAPSISYICFCYVPLSYVT